MKTIKLMNVSLSLEENYNHILVDKYKIVQLKHHCFETKYFTKHNQNAYAQFEGRQENSIIFLGGVTGNKYNPTKIKFIDDVLLIGSLLTGSNWCICSRSKSTTFPFISHSHLENIQLDTKEKIEEVFSKAISRIKNKAWQVQYENGFHLRILLNHSNIINAESRFLSNVVIWEWLYPHLKNPNGATPDDECDNLNVIINYILDYYWPDRQFIKNNIYVALRNQLAHSGKLPINRQRSYVENWMVLLTWETEKGVRGIKDYMRFFDKLTQVIVLKTLEIDAENILVSDLDNFLTYGKLL